MRTELQPAFVLHRRPFRNTSLLLEAFTREHGRIGLVARGASRPKARLRALLQPFTPVLLAWLEGAELATLSAAEERGLPYAMPSARLLSGFYLNELLLRLLTRHDP
ncbi:MAG: DNA repair protein RecO, partial [Candidatus Competibacteraceae bacterium]|nr:DNA repair protein RecO [Candidatus Competibacteraceae bacterium]